MLRLFKLVNKTSISKQYIPLLISFTLSSSSLQSLCSTIFFTSPDASLIIRPYPVGSCTVEEIKVAANSPLLWNLNNSCIVSLVIKGASPVNIATVPFLSVKNSSAQITAWPVPSCSSCIE